MPLFLLLTDIPRSSTLWPARYRQHEERPVPEEEAVDISLKSLIGYLPESRVTAADSDNRDRAHTDVQN